MYISSVVWQDIGAASQIKCSRHKEIIHSTSTMYSILFYVYCIVWLKQILVQRGETTSSMVNIQTQDRNMKASRQYRSFRALWTELYGEVEVRWV